MALARQGLDKLVGMLLGLGADPDSVDNEGHTALDLAADAGHFSTAATLTASGANIATSQRFKQVISNPHQYAGESTQAMTKEETSRVDVDGAAIGQLGRAARDGDLDSLRSLIGSDIGPSLCDIEDGAELGHSAFLLASLEGHVTTMDLLLSRGANINTTSKLGWTPLMLACRRGDEASIAYLLAHGADVNHLSPDKWSALTEATINGSLETMRRLLEAGADPEVKAQSDWTPLMHACFRGHLGCLELLLDSGASHGGVSTHDETPMLLAAASGRAAVVRRLLDAGCAPDSQWSMAQGLDNAGATRNPRTAEQRIERAYKVGWTPLMVAAQAGHLDVAVMLLNAGANPDSRSPMMKTALEIARENGMMEVANYLASWPRRP